MIPFPPCGCTALLAASPGARPAPFTGGVPGGSFDLFFIPQNAGRSAQVARYGHGEQQPQSAARPSSRARPTTLSHLT